MIKLLFSLLFIFFNKFAWMNREKCPCRISLGCVILQQVILQDIDDLKRRLNNTRLPKPSLEGVAWTYGLPGQFLPKIIDNWLNKYDFKKREDYINKYPQFLTNIQGY